jgi:hypothetical protein
LVAQVAVGRVPPPILVAAIEKVEQDRTRHDRNPRRTDGIPAALLGEPCHDPARRIDAEGRAPAQGDRVDALDGAFGGEEISLPRAWRSTTDIDRSDRGLIEDHHRDAGGENAVLRLADGEAGYVGDEVAHVAGLLHSGASRRAGEWSCQSPADDQGVGAAKMA